MNNQYQNYNFRKQLLVYKDKYYNVQHKAPLCTIYAYFILLTIINSEFENYSKMIRYIKHNNFNLNISMFHYQLYYYVNIYNKSSLYNKLHVYDLEPNHIEYYSELSKFFKSLKIKMVIIKSNKSFKIEFINKQNKKVLTMVELEKKLQKI